MRFRLLPPLTRLIKVWGSALLLVFTFVFAVVDQARGQAQITTGTIQGTVTDANGAVLPGANVEAKNLETNFTRSLTTDDGGRFVILALPPGNYSVTVSKQGFGSAVVEKLELTVGQAATVPFSLKVSDVTERVTVTAPTIDTVKTESRSTLNEKTSSTTPRRRR